MFESSHDCILITLENRFIVFESSYDCILITLENIFIVFESSYDCILITLENRFIVLKATMPILYNVREIDYVCKLLCLYFDNVGEIDSLF